MTTLRVLLAADDEDDAGLIVGHLEGAGWDVVVRRIDSAPALADALGVGGWDVVVCDDVLPGLDGSATLRLTRSRDPSLPVVVVSGRSGPDAVAAAVEDGAADHLPRRHLDRLPTVVTHLLRLARERGRLLGAYEALRARERRYRTIANAAPVLLWTTDVEGRARYFNAQWLAFRARRLDEEMRDGWLAGVHPDDRPRCQQVWEAAVTGHRGFEIEHRLLRSDGQYRWMVSRVVTAFLEGTELYRFVGSCTDITDRRRAEDALKESEARIRSVVETAVDAVISANEDGTMTSANPAAERIFGHPVEDLLGQNVSILMPEPYRSEHDGYLARYLATGERRIIGLGREVVGRRRDGSTFPMHLSVTEVQLGGRRTFTGIVRDISDQKRTEAQLAHQALHDPLTGLANRALLLDRVSSALVRSRRHPVPLAVLFCDLDRFKVVNDSLGHGAGDEVLRLAAARLSAIVRPADTVARLGGDEFVLLCETLDDRRAETVAERVLHALREPFEILATEVYLSASIGIAIDQDGTAEPDALVRDADQAMYQAKWRGKDRFELFDAHLRRRALARVETEQALHRALERGELQLHYQPEISLMDGGIVAFEVLLRWRHPDRGLVGPVEFLPVAEETGLIEPIGDWVIEETCREALRWCREGALRRPTVLWVNLSARQLSLATLVSTVGAAVASMTSTPVQLGLEITESTIMNDAESSVTTTRALRGMGARLAIDDFGTGYSSLSYLKRFPIDTLKIDRSFVGGLAHDQEDAAIVTAVVGLAEALGLQVVAEGAETRQQVDELVTLRCGLAQGYYFARPLPAADAAALLAAWSTTHPPWGAAGAVR